MPGCSVHFKVGCEEYFLSQRAMDVITPIINKDVEYTLVVPDADNPCNEGTGAVGELFLHVTKYKAGYLGVDYISRAAPATFRVEE